MKLEDDAVNWSEIDKSLSSICEKRPYLANDILDFRLNAHRQTQPGRCIKAYFDFATSVSCDEEICCLRKWLEKSVEVEAICLKQEEPLEAFPFKVSKANDLEDYCLEVMRSMHQDRAYEGTDIKLQFRYRSN